LPEISLHIVGAYRRKRRNTFEGYLPIAFDTNEMEKGRRPEMTIRWTNKEYGKEKRECHVKETTLRSD
jgi:hypothetical protein